MVQFATTWSSRRGNRKFLDSDLDRYGVSIPGISEWLVDHYVCLLPAPSNCVGTIGTYHCDEVARLMALVSDTDERPGLWLPGVLLQVAFIRGMAEEPLENAWETPWHEILRLFRLGRWSSKSSGDIPGWSYMTKCEVNYVRSREYDHCLRSLRHLGDPGGTQTADVPSQSPFDPRPYGPVYATIVKHHNAMWELNPFSPYSEREQPEQPQPETPCARTLSNSVRYASATFQYVRGLQSSFAGAGITESKKLEQRLKHRMLRYPVEGWLDGGITVAIPNFLSVLAGEIGGDEVDEVGLVDRFLLFRKWEGLDHRSPLPEDTLHLPILLINHQNDEYTSLSNETKNAQRLACVSAVSFLAALGVKDFPVYGLSTYGYAGVVAQAWYSEEDNCCYAMDGVTPRYRFNLCREEGILRLINFLDKLEEHAQELRRRFEVIRPAFLERARTKEGRAAASWTFHAQLTEHDLWEHPRVFKDDTSSVDVDSASDRDASDSDYWSDVPNSEGFLDSDY